LNPRHIDDDYQTIRRKERKGKERKGKERKGKERKGKERKGKERKGKETKQKGEIIEKEEIGMNNMDKQ
jgi:hypothetical protein